MTILLNNVPTKLPQNNMTLSDLVATKNIPVQGTAIAVNDHLVKQSQWPVTILNELDSVTVISAAYGG